MNDATGAGPLVDDKAYFRDAARTLGVDKLRDGSWFRRLVAKHAKHHAATMTIAHWEKVYPRLDVEERAHREIARVARKTSMTGAVASAGSSAGELLSLVTDGVGAAVGIPVAVGSMLLEAAYTTLLQIDLACDLASIYGVPFDGDDVGEVATLFGLALEVDVRASKAVEEDEKEAPSGLTRSLMELEDGAVAKRIGKKLIEEAIIRNIAPVIGIAISARWNYVATKKIGATVKRYARYRDALRRACQKLHFDRVSDPGRIIEGAWLLATVDGEAGHEEVMALAYIMDQLPADKRREVEIDKTLGDDEEAWFEDIATLPAEMHGPLLDTLYMIAATDKALEPPERRFLRRVGKALGREIDFERVAQICRHLSDGEDLPDDYLSASAKT
jgi:hypothetical protein